MSLKKSLATAAFLSIASAGIQAQNTDAVVITTADLAA